MNLNKINKNKKQPKKTNTKAKNINKAKRK